MEETFFDRFLRRKRIERVLPHIKSVSNPTLLDIGCGWDGKFLSDMSAHIKLGIGIDKKAPVSSRYPNIIFIRHNFIKSLPFRTGSFNLVSLLAVLEHVGNPGALLREIQRVLAPGGLLVGTVPSTLAKPVLEFLAYKLHIIDANEIRDHKKYYNRAALMRELKDAHLNLLFHRYFQLGCNNVFVAKK